MTRSVLMCAVVGMFVCVCLKKLKKANTDYLSMKLNQYITPRLIDTEDRDNALFKKKTLLIGGRSLLTCNPIMPDAAYTAGRQMCAADEGPEGKHERQCQYHRCSHATSKITSLQNSSKISAVICQ
jgi:hypothetical protein